MHGKLVGFKPDGSKINEIFADEYMGEKMVNKLSEKMVVAWYNVEGVLMRMGGKDCHLIVPTRYAEVK